MRNYREILENAEMVLNLLAEKPKFPKGPGLGTIGYGVNLDDPQRFVGSQKPRTKVPQGTRFRYNRLRS